MALSVIHNLACAMAIELGSGAFDAASMELGSGDAHVDSESSTNGTLGPGKPFVADTSTPTTCPELKSVCGEFPRVLFLDYYEEKDPVMGILTYQCDCGPTAWKVIFWIVLVVFLCGGCKCLKDRKNSERTVVLVDGNRLISQD